MSKEDYGIFILRQSAIKERVAVQILKIASATRATSFCSLTSCTLTMSAPPATAAVVVAAVPQPRSLGS